MTDPRTLPDYAERLQADPRDLTGWQEIARRTRLVFGRYAMGALAGLAILVFMFGLLAAGGGS